MAEDLQYLMERIQKDAVDKAENEAAAIIAKAKEKAADIVKAAEAEASARLEKADKDAEAFTERSERTLEQSARDLLLSVGKNLEKMIMDLLNLQVEKSLDESTVKSMLLTLAKNYSSDIEVDFSDADARKLSSFVMGEFAKQLSAALRSKATRVSSSASASSSMAAKSLTNLLKRPWPMLSRPCSVRNFPAL